MSNFISRKQIRELSKNILGEPFEVPEWNGTIYIKKWTGTERAKFITKIQGIYAEGDTGKPKDIESLFDFQTEVVAMSLYGEDGQPLYDSKNPEDIIEVGQIEADLLQKLFAECAGRNGLVEGKAKEDIRNLEIGQS